MIVALWVIGYLLAGVLTALAMWRWKLGGVDPDISLLLISGVLWPMIPFVGLLLWLGEIELPSYEEWHETREERRRLREERERQPSEVVPWPPAHDAQEMRPMPEAMFDNLAEDAVLRNLELLRRLAGGGDES